MNILVLVKQTFDTEEPVEIENGKISEQGIRLILNPYDEYAVEQAVQIKEEFGGQVTVVTLGPDYSESVLRTAMAMGADRATLIENESLVADEYLVSTVLAHYCKQEYYDLIFCGQATVDGGSAQIGPRVSELLGIPCITAILKFHLEGNTAIVERDVDGNSEKIEVLLPALFTTQQGLNEPRYPSLPQVMKAKRKPVQHLSAIDMANAEDGIRSITQTVEYFLPPKKAPGRILSGSLTEQARELAQLLSVEGQK